MQGAELRMLCGLAEIKVETPVKVGRTTQHTAGFCQPEILRLQVRGLGEIAEKFGEGRGAIIEQSLGRRVSRFRGLKNNGKKARKDFVGSGVHAGLQIGPGGCANFGKYFPAHRNVRACPLKVAQSSEHSTLAHVIGASLVAEQITVASDATGPPLRVAADGGGSPSPSQPAGAPPTAVS